MKSELRRRIVVRSCRSDRLFRTAPSRQTVLRASARLRQAVPAPTGRTGQRSAFQAVPALFSRLAVRGFDRLSAVDAGRRPALRCRARPTRFGGTRFPGLRATLSSGVRAEKGAIPTGQGPRRRGPAGRGAGPHRENCPEVGVPSRPRAFAQSAVRGFDRLSAVDAGRRPALRCRARSTRFGGTRGFKPSPRFFSLGGTPSAALRAAVPV